MVISRLHRPLSLTLATLGLITLVACGGGGGGSNPPPVAIDDTTPNAFSFTATEGAEPNAVITSPTATISGINTATPISISGGEYSIAGGAFTSAAGTITNGQSLVVRLTASDKTNTAKAVTVTIGGVSATFNVTTLVDITADAFSFTAVTGAELNKEYTSETITVSGIDVAVPVSVSGGLYSINGGEFTSSASSVSAGQTITLKATSGNNTDTTQNAVLSVGSISGTFAVTTIPDTTPPVAEFKFPTPYTMSEANTVKVRGTATDDHAITEVKLIVRSYNLASPDVTIKTEEVIADPKSTTGDVKDFSSWTATIPLATAAENEIKVVAMDARNNEIVIEKASKVVIRQADVSNAFPNDNNPIKNPEELVIDNYDGRNRLLVYDFSQRTIFEIFVDTGERVVLKDYRSDEEIDLLTGLLAVGSGASQALYGLDPSEKKLIKLDPLTGQFLDSFYYEGFQNAYILALDDSENEENLVMINSSYSSEDNSDVIAFDLNKKIFSVVSSGEMHGKIRSTRAIAFDKTRNRYLVSFSDDENNLYGIYSVDKANGARKIFSTNDIGGGVPFDNRATFTELTVDNEKNILYAPDYMNGKIFQIDLIDGKRSVLAELNYPDSEGNMFPRRINEFRVVWEKQYAYLTDVSGLSVLIIDLTSGETLMLSNFGH